MDNAFQARLRAARSVRPPTRRERIIRAALWLATGTIITGLICASPNYEFNFFAFLPLLVGIAGAVSSCRRKYEVTEFTAEAQQEIQAAKWKDREERLASAKAFALGWFGRLVASSLVLFGCYLYVSDASHLSADEELFLGALVLVALAWAWQTALVLLFFAGIWWVGQLDWHISTSSAVIFGAIIIALAIKSKR
jgi:hypothetical protein